MSDLQQGEQLTPEQQVIAEVLYEMPPLTWSQFNVAAENAKKLTRQNVPAPMRRIVTSQTHSKYPGWFVAIVVTGALLLFAGLAVITTAKQLEAIRIYSDPITYDGYALGTAVVTLSLMLFGELGALLFGIIDGIFVKRMFTFAAWVCAGAALLANIYVTLLHRSDYEGILLYAWYMTIAAPLLVLGIGAIFKGLILEALAARNERHAKQMEYDAQYERDQEAYRVTIDTIDTHPLYKSRYLPLAILDALRKASQSNRELLDQYPQVTRYAQKREMDRNNTEYIEPESLPPIPTITVTQPERPALPERASVKAVSLPRRSRDTGKICIYCNEPFEGKNEYCSKPSCKQKAYRARNKSNDK